MFIATETRKNVCALLTCSFLLQIAVPQTYADRLKVIFNTTVDRIYKTKLIVETLKRQENRFETYITIGNFTRRYYGEHEKTTTAMEAAAIYYSLKHITNVRVIDLNFPTLARLVSDINRWNAQISMFQLFNNFCLKQTKKIYEDIAHAYHGVNLEELSTKNFCCFNQATTTLFQTMDQYYENINNLCYTFDSCKVICKLSSFP